MPSPGIPRPIKSSIVSSLRRCQRDERVSYPFVSFRIRHRRTWEGVTMTEEILEILNKRLLITIDVAPIAKWNPIKSLLATQ
jgi:hypothetical protein